MTLMRWKLKKNRNIHINLAKNIKIRLKRDNLLKEIIESITEKDNIYIVGGFIRDILLNKETRDVDFLYDGNLLDLLREIATNIHGSYRYNTRFMTGTLELKGRTFDFATTRCEKYPKPGILPVVKYCPLERDFKRRDFTINAIVWDIKNSKIIDPLGGVEDILSGILRITYEKSFIDDPTRMVRGVRFAGKYLFNIDKKTVRCYNTALKKDSLSTISASRLKRELDLIFMERSFENISLLIEKIGLFKCSSKKFTHIYPYLNENNIPQFNRDYFIMSCIDDSNVKRAYPREWDRLNRMSKLNEEGLFNVYKRFGDTALLLYLLFKGKSGITSINILKKIRKFDRMKVGGIIKKFKPKLPKYRYVETINKIANMYLEGKLKSENDIKIYINRMEV